MCTKINVLIESVRKPGDGGSGSNGRWNENLCEAASFFPIRANQQEAPLFGSQSPVDHTLRR